MAYSRNAFLAVLASFFLLAGCISVPENKLPQYSSPPPAQPPLPAVPSKEQLPAENNTTQLANPSATYCVENGYNYEIRTNEDGSQDGVCIFPNGNECEGWAYFRGECNENGTVAPVLAKEGEVCGGVASMQCESGLVCKLNESERVTDRLGICVAPGEPQQPDKEFHICPEERAEACTLEYNPVCGQSVQVGSIVYFNDYGNPCVACSQSSNAVGYLFGTCASHGK